MENRKWSESGTGDMEEYWMVTTTDERGDKGLDGGIMKRQNPQQHQVTNSIDVKSVDEYSSKVQQLGGKVVYPKMAITGMGYFAGCLDTEGNSFGIFEYNESAK
jgi:uncharacterized protein